jgi:NAD(P)-dependent dehydrogenase (short-subunit alcohol dehydrogenase family)
LILKKWPVRSFGVNYIHSSMVHFSRDDLALFSAASHDQNPRHLSAEYARKTSYGQQVVFGILGALACLGRVKPPSNSELTKVSLEFRHAMFLDIPYAVLVGEQSSETMSAKLCDGSSVLVKADFTFAESDVTAAPLTASPYAVRTEPADPDDKEVAEGAARGKYWPDQTALTALVRRFGISERACGQLQLSCLLWSSYLIGMELPGLRSLFSKLALAFQESDGRRAAPLSYEAKAISVNAFGSLRSELRLFSGEQLVAHGESRAFVIPRNRTNSINELSALVPQSEQLKGRVGLVVGASRGLGAMIAGAMALQGCTVVANFKESEAEALRLQQGLEHAPGKMVLAKGDAADVGWCENLRERITSDFGRLDFLICNACPALLSFQIESKTVARINNYVRDAFALVSVPLSVFSNLLAANSGWSAVVSSVAVETSPREWPHYVATKCAIEGLVRVAAQQYPQANYLLVRPARLQTDLVNGPSNVPFGLTKAALPEVAAARIVERLQGAPIDKAEIFAL